MNEDDVTTVVFETKGGPLTTDDFESEAPSPGISDARYSGAGKAAIDAIATRVAKAAAAALND